MTRDELREKVAKVLCCEIMGIEYDVMPESATYMERKTNPESAILDKQEAKEIADAAIDTIFAALKEPTEEMIDAFFEQQSGDEEPTKSWKLMLSASPLAPSKEKK